MPRANLGPVTVRADGAPMSVIARQKHREAEQNLEQAENQLENLRSSVSVDKPEIQTQLLAAEKYTEEEDVYDDSTCINDEPSVKRPKPDPPSSDVGSPQKLLDHFCSVELPSEDCDQWQTLFSQFDQPDKIGCMIVELHAGEMLYLPASWFHEVTSYDDNQSETSADTAGHLALNYWMYPPDGDTFEQPYKDDFWPQRWAKICASKVSVEFTNSDAGIALGTTE